MATDIRVKNDILRVLAAAPVKGYRSSQLMEIMGHLDLKRFRRLLREMTREELVEKTPSGGWKLHRQAPEIIGILSISAQGCGFVTPQADNASPKQSDVFIPPGRIGSALSGDQVRVKITETDDSRGPVGEILEVLQRGYTKIVGALVETVRGPAIRPLRRELPPIIPLICPEEQLKNFSRSHAGDWIEADLQPGDQPEQLLAVFQHRMAAGGSVKADLDAVAREYDLPHQYTETAEKHASELEPLEVPREDLTNLTVFTMDPVDARDYDDALSFEEGPAENECTVGVHIADVGCFVQKGNFLDKAAAKRGFTSYLPGRTIPMLPRAISNESCSLKAGVVRLAHTVMLRIDRRSGAILSWRRFHSRIKVSQRLCYEDAEDFIQGRQVELSVEVKSVLENLLSISRKLRQYRRDVEMFIPMEMPELRIVCTEKPSRILGLQETEHSEAHELVEEFMLAANQCVALELQQSRIPAVYRNHPEPEEDAMAEFAVQAEQMLGHKVRRIRTRRDLVRFLLQVNKTPLRDIVNLALLRHFPRASYGIENEGHFGLGKKNYCQFTSPIRRYSDLVVHQQLLARDLHKKGRTSETMQLIAQTVSAQEENCDQAAFAAADRLKLRYLLQLQEENPEMQLQASVIRASKMGIMVFVNAYGLMAAVSWKDFPEGNWKYIGMEMCWMNKSTGEKIQVRDTVSCFIKNADPVRGELDLQMNRASAGRKNKRRRR